VQSRAWPLYLGWKRSTPQIRIRAEKKVLLRNIKVSFNTLKYEMRQLYYKLRLKLFKFNIKTRFDVLKLLKVAPGAWWFISATSARTEKKMWTEDFWRTCQITCVWRCDKWLQGWLSTLCVSPVLPDWKSLHWESARFIYLWRARIVQSKERRGFVLFWLFVFISRVSHFHVHAPRSPAPFLQFIAKHKTVLPIDRNKLLI